MPSANVLHVIAADHLKLNFPMAWAAATLAWGFIEFQDVSPCSPLASGVKSALFILNCRAKVVPDLC